MSTQPEHEFSFKSLFVPFTTLKAIHWITFIGIVVYANMLFNGFVWDDITYIINNSETHTFNVFSYFGKTLFNTAGQYRAGAEIYFALLFSVFNNQAFFYHLIQLLIHCANAILVFVFFKKYLNKNISFLLSLIFLIHPMQVESVSFVASTDNPLFFLLGMSAFLLSTKGKNSNKQALIISVLLLGSILVKETGFLFLVIILSYRYLFIKAKDGLFYMYFLLLTVAYFIVRIGIGGTDFNQPNPQFKQILMLSLSERILTIPAIFYYYIKTFIYPVNLSIDQLWTVTQINTKLFYMTLLLDMLFLLFLCCIGYYVFSYFRAYFKLYLFFLIWFIVGLSFHLQLFPLDMTVADRWFYFPMVGLLGMIGILIQCLLLRYKKTEKLLVTSLGIVIILFSFRTMVRNTNWSNEITLYSHDARVDDNQEIENNLGIDLSSQGKYQEALSHFKKSIEIMPYIGNYYSIALDYQNLQDLQMAKTYYEKALTSKTHAGDEVVILLACENMSKVLLEENNPKEALIFARKGLRLFPENTTLLEYLALGQYLTYQNIKATNSIRKALSLDPKNIEIIYVYNQIINNRQVKIN